MTGGIATLAGAPFDIVKTRMQAGEASGSVLQAIRNIIQTEGTSALYRGAGTKLLRVTIGTFIALTTFEFFWLPTSEE